MMLFYKEDGGSHVARFQGLFAKRLTQWLAVARKGYRLDSDRAAGEWAQLCRQLVCVGSSAGN